MVTEQWCLRNNAVWNRFSLVWHAQRYGAAGSGPLTRLHTSNFSVTISQGRIFKHREPSPLGVSDS